MISEQCDLFLRTLLCYALFGAARRGVVNPVWWALWSVSLEQEAESYGWQ